MRMMARQKGVKMRSLHGENENFEPLFNAASAGLGINQSFLKTASKMCTGLGITVLWVFAIATFNVSAQASPPATVEQVDLQKYVGQWFEIAKIPNWFQRNCARNTSANYSLRDDRRIDVVNRCEDEDGDTDAAAGIARVVDTQSNAKLEVSFFKLFGMSLFWGDYWILDLGEQYDYVVVGTPSRKYGWILSRSPELEDKTLQTIYTRLRVAGYDPDVFVMTPHTQ